MMIKAFISIYVLLLRHAEVFGQSSQQKFVCEPIDSVCAHTQSYQPGSNPRETNSSSGRRVIVGLKGEVGITGRTGRQGPKGDPGVVDYDILSEMVQVKDRQGNF